MFIECKIPRHWMSLPDSGHDAGFEVVCFPAINAGDKISVNQVRVPPGLITFFSVWETVGLNPL